ncbi:SDR family oxidoreductase [Actinokineospora spheciospongiae]|uniref:SDR family oxidoreductase n=1 Tax=Actinokineospora spheciospongiae TaxID=909613 RepID=UPI000D71AA05|nr:SDR family oxidoreductase [Actinokineospora spheciospongiae]
MTTTGRTDTQVVVVGAGPVGLLLAGELRLGGAEVVVLERLPEPTTESRASTLHARTMDVLDSRGLVAALGNPPNEPRGHFGGIPLDLTLPGAHPGQWKVPQTTTERVLRDWAVGLGADLRRGHAVRGLSVGADHVEVTADGPRGPVRLRALCVVGCDGQDSTVRELAGIPFPGTGAARELVRADVAGIDIPNRRFQRLEKGFAVAARRGDGVTRVMAHEFGRAPGPDRGEPTFAEVVDTWRRVTGEDIGHGEPLWLNRFDDTNRQAARYRDGRVLLAGDAAHRQLPVGGQALNLGLQDAVNLGWKLAAQVRGLAGPGLLDSYHAERHAVGARTLADIAAQALLLFGGPEVEPVRDVVAELMAYPGTREHLAGAISGLGTRYDVGPGEHPLLGAPVPPLRLAVAGQPGERPVAELLRGGRGLLLVTDTGAAERLRAAADPWADRVTTAVGSTRDALAPALLVRPDGHVVWAGEGDPVPALDRWFGVPTARRGGPGTEWPGTTGPSTHPSTTHPSTTRNGRATPDGARHTDDRERQTMGRFTGKTALVTGSSRGMGRATALRLAREGALVAVHYTSDDVAAKDTVETVEREGGRAFAVRAELGVPGDVHELFLGVERGLKERTGAAVLDILVNNAGTMGGVEPEATTPDQFDRIFAVNAKAPFFTIQRALRIMPDGGRIVNISSGLTRVANPQEIAYAMSKGAVEQLARHFAKHLGPRGITVNSVAPGITRNGNPVFDMPQVVEQMARLSALGRVGEPEDVADVVAFLVSEEARWITGAFVDASGGSLLG